MKQVMAIAVLIFLFFLSGDLRAQSQSKGIVVTGKVISCEERSALEGVTVQVKDTRNISGTLFDGMYAIEIRPVDTILVFSYEGYESKEVKIVEDRREYNVMLKRREGAFCLNK